MSYAPNIAPDSAEAVKADKPSLVITIDTEGDNLWALPKTITTENAAFINRFQELCERYRLRPTWLTNWEMARAPRFREFGCDVLRRQAGEVGMHLHAWNNPPLTAQDTDTPQQQSCLIEYPIQVMKDKIDRLTDLLEDVFEVKMISHRAGRWAFNSAYARALAERGYLVDCSVTPHLSWQYGSAGQSHRSGCDYRGFPERAYWLDLDQISKQGTSQLLEVPMTIMPGRRNWLSRSLHRLAAATRTTQRVADRLLPRHYWFRPFRGNVATLPRMLDWAEQRSFDYVEFMLHSSEFMPGGSPSFPTESAIERLYERLEALFERARDRFVGRTLAEYRSHFVRNHRDLSVEGVPTACDSN